MALNAWDIDNIGEDLTLENNSDDTVWVAGGNLEAGTLGSSTVATVRLLDGSGIFHVRRRASSANARESRARRESE